MLYLRSINRFILISLALLGLSVSSANAATLNVSGGQLIGASGVDVGGTLYDVELVDGTCIGLFGGCDAISDFAFSNLSDASLASQALLDQVFLGVFDNTPSLVFGCPDPGSGCSTYTPYGFDSGGGDFRLDC